MRDGLAQITGPDGASFDDDFGAMLATQAAALGRYARRLAGSGADADDLLQDTMLRCWSARQSFAQGTNLGAWARTVMRNSFLSGRRRVRFHVELAEEGFDRLLSVAENQSHVVELRDASWALNELPADQRAAVLLASEGVTSEDAALQLAIPEGTFKSRVARGRVRLRRLNEERDTPLLPGNPKIEQRPAKERPRQRRDWKGVMIG